MRYVVEFFALLVSLPLVLRHCKAHPEILLAVAAGILCLIIFSILKWTSVLARVHNFQGKPPVE